MVPETKIHIDAISENTIEEITNFTQKLRRTNQILLEQSKDPILLQLKAKIQKEEDCEEILQQDTRYKDYLNNMDRIVIKDEIVTMQYYDETGQIEYHQIPNTIKTPSSRIITSNTWHGTSTSRHL